MSRKWRIKGSWFLPQWEVIKEVRAPYHFCPPFSTHHIAARALHANCGDHWIISPLISRTFRDSRILLVKLPLLGCWHFHLIGMKKKISLVPPMVGQPRFWQLNSSLTYLLWPPSKCPAHRSSIPQFVCLRIFSPVSTSCLLVFFPWLVLCHFLLDMHSGKTLVCLLCYKQPPWASQ